MSDKLPEWPEDGDASARMEALRKYAQHKPGCRIDAVGLDCGKCTCGLSELLAACERSVAAQPSGAGRRKS